MQGCGTGELQVTADGDGTGGQKTARGDLHWRDAVAKGAILAGQHIGIEPRVGIDGGRAQIGVDAIEHQFTGACFDQVTAFRARDHTIDPSAASAGGV